mmetsp:Transcript_789/g.1056  ORF Transcript_789/g.1056 Transcript_789/m.1056 type:complete len:347 (-) Transcript_789:814-1854(-)
MLSLSLCLLLMGCLAATLIYALECTSTDFAVVGYFPEWRYALLDEDHEDRLGEICNVLSHLILFSVEVDEQGNIVAQDRFPDKYRLERVHKICTKQNNVKILLCFGGNARSNGFSQVVQNPKLRRVFIDNVVEFISVNGLDGIDWNWEYPSSSADWLGLRDLIRETRAANPKLVQTMAYYPDGRQERIIKNTGMHEDLDMIHMMAYDQPGKHSTYQLAKRSVENALKFQLPADKLTLGLPMYGRHIQQPEWKTYADLCESESKSENDADFKENCQGENENEVDGYYFNGVAMIKKKTKYALRDAKIGGVMIWESGQDTTQSTLHKAIHSIIAQSESEHNQPETCLD